MKKIISIATACSFLLFLTGCLKDKPLNDFASTAKPIVEFGITSSGNSHGMEGFSNDNIATAGQVDPIVVPLVVNIASTYPLSKDVSVTLATGGVQYEAQPDSTFSFAVTSGIIKAGTRLDTFYVTFFPDKIDPTINYMLPIKIADASGETISGNFSVAYLHEIGNPLAGNVTHEWLRWNGRTGAPPDPTVVAPTFDQVYADVFSPLDPTTVEIQSGTGTIYILSFDNNLGVLSNFKVSFPNDDGSGNTVGTASWAGITITSGPTILLADPVNHNFTFTFDYLNGSGAPRVIEDIITPP